MKWYIKRNDEIVKEVEGTEAEVRLSVQILNAMDPAGIYAFGSREEEEDDG